MNMDMNVPGYEALRLVLQRAYNQAALNKGAERHGNSLPFHEQPMQTIANKRGVGFLFGQADKKTEEVQGMLARGETGKAVHELLGAINYLAGAIINIESQNTANTVVRDGGKSAPTTFQQAIGQEGEDVQTPSEEQIPAEVLAMAKDVGQLLSSLGINADVHVGVMRI